MVQRNAPNNAYQYSRTGLQSEVESASPHRLVQMLMKGVLDKIATAKGCMTRQQVELKGMQINWAISIINGLRVSLDKERGGELAEHLEDLYQYMMRRLGEAHSDNDVAKLNEVAGLMREIKNAWDAIPDEVKGLSKAALEEQLTAAAVKSRASAGT